LGNKKYGKALEKANKEQVLNVIIICDDEVKIISIKLKICLRAKKGLYDFSLEDFEKFPYSTIECVS
jgi:transcriptional antiterminator